jgi:hypothetical protein
MGPLSFGPILRVHICHATSPILAGFSADSFPMITANMDPPKWERLRDKFARAKIVAPKLSGSDLKSENIFIVERICF